MAVDIKMFGPQKKNLEEFGTFVKFIFHTFLIYESCFLIRAQCARSFKIPDAHQTFIFHSFEIILKKEQVSQLSLQTTFHGYGLCFMLAHNQTLSKNE